MLHVPKNTIALTRVQAKRLWLHAQRLDETAPFGDGPDATGSAVAHLGYVQIDSIHVVERSHHHILFTRIPEYRRADLHRAQTIDKSVFEYWAHALAYIPTADMRFFTGEMRAQRSEPTVVTRKELRRLLSRIRRKGPLTIRDITDDVPIEKDHAWASRKPSVRVLRRAFYNGQLTVSERTGILKTYELIERHFGFKTLPRPAPERQLLDYLLDRALRSQGVIGLDSVCFHDAPHKTAMRRLIEGRVRRKALVRVAIDGADKPEFWMRPDALEAASEPTCCLVHVLSPFDPLIIQRKRLRYFFDYDHLFEAYVPKRKRKRGYFALPVLVDDAIVAAIDLKTDRQNKKVLVQKWTWLTRQERDAHKKRIEEALHRFERFQLAK